MNECERENLRERRSDCERGKKSGLPPLPPAYGVIMYAWSGGGGNSLRSSSTGRSCSSVPRRRSVFVARARSAQLAVCVVHAGFFTEWRT